MSRVILKGCFELWLKMKEYFVDFVFIFYAKMCLAESERM